MVAYRGQSGRIEHVAGIVERLITKAALETSDETAFVLLRRASLRSDGHKRSMKHWTLWHTQCDCWMETANLYDSVEKAVIDAFLLSPSDFAAIAEAEARRSPRTRNVRFRKRKSGGYFARGLRSSPRGRRRCAVQNDTP